MADNNAKSAKPSGSAPACTSKDTNPHKLRAMGKGDSCFTAGDSGKKTPA